MQLYQPTITGSLLVSGSVITNGTITATTLVVQTVTSSVSYLTGSTQFGSLSSNTHQFTGSMFITGGLSVGTTSSSDLVTIGGATTRGTVSIWGSTTTNPVLQLSNTNAGGSSWNIYAGYGSDSKQFVIYDATNSQPRLAISASGNVGIKTTTPDYALDVNGAIRTDGTSNAIYLRNTLTGVIKNPTVGDRTISFETNAEAMRIVASGNVGIGTTSPSDIIDIQKNQNGTTNFYLRNTDTTNTNSRAYLNLISGNMTLLIKAIHGDHAYVTPSAGSDLYLGYNNFVRVSSNGQILQNVSTAISGDNAAVFYNTHSTNSYGVYIGAGTGNNHALYVTDYSRNSALLKVQGNGYVFMGNSSSGLGGMVQIDSFNGQGSGFDGLGVKTGGATNAVPLLIWNNTTAGNNEFARWYTETASTQRGGIDYNRGAGQVRYNVTSDANLKNIIGDSDLSESINILKNTRIREYSWKEDTTNKVQTGVIAQELYEVFKGAVSVGGEVEKIVNGETTTEYKTWGVDKTAFTFHLIAGWQKHQEIIEQLKAEIETLKNK